MVFLRMHQRFSTSSPNNQYYLLYCVLERHPRVMKKLQSEVRGIAKDKDFVGKFRPRLIELTSFKPKLLIRFIMNKTC